MTINLEKSVADLIFSSAWDQVGFNYAPWLTADFKIYNCLAHYSIYYSNGERMWRKIYFNDSIHGFIRESLL